MSLIIWHNNNSLLTYLLMALLFNFNEPREFNVAFVCIRGTLFCFRSVIAFVENV